MPETPDGYASMSSAVRRYGFTVSEIKNMAVTLVKLYAERAQDFAIINRRENIASPSVYEFWKAVAAYVTNMAP